jgi:hypothetical protein
MLVLSSLQATVRLLRRAPPRSTSYITLTNAAVLVILIHVR